MLVRPMTAGDIAAVSAIEAEFSSSWTITQIAAEVGRKAGCALVAETASREIMGWCCGVLIAPDAELLKVAVGSRWQRQGIATALLHRLCQLFREKGGERMFLEVRSRNDSALQLYRRSGWKMKGKRKKYYQMPVDDAILLVRSLQE